MPKHITKSELKGMVDSDPKIVTKVTILQGDRVNIAIEGIRTTFYWCSLKPTNMPKGISEMNALKDKLIRAKGSFMWYDRKAKNEGVHYYYENGVLAKTKQYGSDVAVTNVHKVNLEEPEKTEKPKPKEIPMQSVPHDSIDRTWDFAGLSLPIRSLASIPELIRGWIPKEDNGYIHDKNVTRRIMTSLIRGKAIFLKGHTGTGKTELLRSLAYHCNQPFLILPCSADMETANLLGYLTTEDEDVVFVEGLLTTAVRHGAWIYFDEFNAMSADITSNLNPLLDGSQCLVLTEDRGRKVDAHHNFRFLASGNPATHAGYRGAQTQNLSLVNRMRTIMIDYLDDKQETKLLVDLYRDVPIDYVNRLVKVANKIRILFKSGKIQVVMTTRDLKDILADMMVVKDAFNGNWDKAIDDALASWVGTCEYKEDASSVYAICTTEMVKGIPMMEKEKEKIIS